MQVSPALASLLSFITEKFSRMLDILKPPNPPKASKHEIPADIYTAIACIFFFSDLSYTNVEL